MKYLLDTSVIKELISKKPNKKVVEFVDSLDHEDMYLSAITIGEIARATQKQIDPKRKKELETWLREGLLVRFDENIIPLDANIMIRWGQIYGILEDAGIKLPAIDSMIVATVLTHRMVLVTMNESDFEGTGIEIVNPW